MAIDITVQRRKKFYNGFMVTADIELDDDYPTGGWEVKPSDLGLSNFDMVTLEDTSDYILKFDSENNKIMAFDLSGATDILDELANESGVLDDEDVRVIAIGS